MTVDRLFYMKTCYAGKPQQFIHFIIVYLVVHWHAIKTIKTYKKFLSDSKLTPFKTTNVTLSIVKSDRANNIPPQYIVLRILTVTTI